MEEVPASPGGQFLLLPGLHEDDREDAGGPFRGEPVDRQQPAGHRQEDEPGTDRAGRPRRRRPSRYVHHDRARRSPVPVGGTAGPQPFPDVERIRPVVAGRGRRVQEAPVGGLQEDRFGGELGEGAQHPGDAAAVQQGAGTAPVDLLGLPEQGVVAVDQLRVDLLGDGHEGHLPVELHQRQSGRPGGVDQGGGQLREPGSQFDHEGGDAPLGQFADEGPLVGGAGPDAQARGEQQLAALEERGQVRRLAGVHPPHRPVELLLTGQHLGEAAAQPRQFQRSAHGDSALVLHGCGRYCPPGLNGAPPLPGRHSGVP